MSLATVVADLRAEAGDDQDKQEMLVESLAILLGETIAIAAGESPARMARLYWVAQNAAQTAGRARAAAENTARSPL